MPLVEEPDDPNKCPYKDVQHFIQHIKSQQYWLDWRSAPVSERQKLARGIAKRFHPDKCVIQTITYVLLNYLDIVLPL